MGEQTLAGGRGDGERARRGVDLVRLAGVQVAIDYSWIAIFLLVTWSLSAGYFPHHHPGRGWAAYLAVGIAASLLFFASVLIHELAHAVMANRLGQPVRRITLFLFGGMAHLSSEPRSPADEFRIAAVGPLTSLALGGLFWGVARGLAAVGVDVLWASVFRYLGFINVALAVFNLLPGFPLDGGRLLRAYFWYRSGDLRRASSRAADWGNGIAIGLMVLGGVQIFAGALVGGLWLIFIGMFLRGAARASYYGVVVEQALGSARVRDIMVPDPVVVAPEASVEDAIEDCFLRRGYGGFPVASGDRVYGLLSLSMVQECPRQERATRAVRDIMSGDLDAVSIGPDATVSEALARMVERDHGRLLVLREGRLVGLITRTGIARFVQLRSQLDGGTAGTGPSP